MNCEIRIRPEVVADVAEAFRWYEQQGEGLGHDFLRAYYACLGFVQRNPEARAQAYGRFRRSLLRRFPYAVFYVVEDRQLVIILLTHCARDPEWMREQLVGRIHRDPGQGRPPDKS